MAEVRDVSWENVTNGTHTKRKNSICLHMIVMIVR